MCVCVADLGVYMMHNYNQLTCLYGYQVINDEFSNATMTMLLHVVSIISFIYLKTILKKYKNVIIKMNTMQGNKGHSSNEVSHTSIFRLH